MCGRTQPLKSSIRSASLADPWWLLRVTATSATIATGAIIVKPERVHLRKEERELGRLRAQDTLKAKQKERSSP